MVRGNSWKRVKWISRKKMGTKLSRRLSNVRNTLCVQARKAEDVVMRKRLGIDEERRVAEVGEGEVRYTSEENFKPVTIEERNRIISTFGRDYNIKNDIEITPVYDSESLEDYIVNKKLDADEANEFRNAYDDSGVMGVAFVKSKGIVVFTDRIKTKGDVVCYVSHELTHKANKQIGFEGMKKYNNAVHNYFTKTSGGIKFLDALQKSEPEDNWTDEMLSYFVGHLIQKYGWDEIFYNKKRFNNWNETLEDYLQKVINLVADEDIKDNTSLPGIGGVVQGDRRKGRNGEDGDFGQEGAERSDQETTRRSDQEANESLMFREGGD